VLRSIRRQRRHFALITRFSLSEAIFLVVHPGRRLGKDCAAVQGEALLLVPLCPTWSRYIANKQYQNA
jgi:hypothetical protein